MIEDKNIGELVLKQGSWLEPNIDDAPIISSRIRLARNLDDYHFPGWATKDQSRAVWKQSCDIFNILTSKYYNWKISDLSETDRDVLFERHLISQDLANNKSDCGVFVSPDESLSIMINEEDHIRIQSLHAGLNLKQAWDEANNIDDKLEENMKYAYSSSLGYLTSCPSNVGTGLRASVMLHLPGLVLLEEMDSVVNGISKIGLAVRGMWGEGTEAVSNMFQISNQITLGKDEIKIIDHLEQIVLELKDHELNARKRLMIEKELTVKDHVSRSYGILKNAHIIASSESLNLLSTLRLGLDLGLVEGFSKQELDKLFISTQPAHLQKLEGSELDPNERDVLRAEMLRLFLKNAKLKIK